jgi:hypothetical protein
VKLGFRREHGLIFNGNLVPREDRDLLKQFKSAAAA